jgi:lipid-A-disaccharide synthase
VVKELVADTMTVEQIRAELQRILYDEAYRRQMLDGYEYMASRLGEAGAPVHAAREMVALLKKRFKK